MRVTIANILIGLLVTGAVAQYEVDPPTTAPPGTILDCTNWVVADATSNCAEIATSYAITLQQFEFTYVSPSSPQCIFF
jgi:hypothetical protein